MKKILIYPAIFKKEENGAYSVFFPDLNQATCGDSLQEAIYMAKDLVGGLAVFYEENEKKEMPKASDLMNIKLDKTGDFVSLIEVDFDNYKKQLAKSIKKTVYIPKDLNDKAEELELNFSKILREALKEALNKKINL